MNRPFGMVPFVPFTILTQESQHQFTATAIIIKHGDFTLRLSTDDDNDVVVQYEIKDHGNGVLNADGTHTTNVEWDESEEIDFEVGRKCE